MKYIPLFILIFVGGVLACEVREVAPTVDGMQEMPDISYGTVVWINNHRVFGFDDRTDTLFAIDLERYSTEVIIDFPLVFWIGLDEDSQIYSCNLRRNGHSGGCLEHDEKHVVTRHVSLKRGLDFFNNILVWQDNLYGNWDIVTCDMRDNGRAGGCLMNDPKRFVTKDIADQTNPSVSVDAIAWEDYRFGTADIFGFNLRKGVEIPLVVASGRQHDPVVRGRTVFFGDNREGNEEIKKIVLPDNLIVNLTNSAVDELNHDVDNGLMAYETSIYGGSSIGVLDLRRNGAFFISVHDREYHPKVSRGQFVFESIANGTSRVFIARC